jgi:asparagine synthase (glutamine-hydrolysing)
MCGIILTTGAKTNPEILDSIKHRGIESQIEKIGNVTLCHHRLPIQTLDGDNWGQPIEISKDVYLMFNGEIFNYDNEKFSSDTEYLCSLFSNYKGGSVEFFSAMYLPHIATWDGFWAIVLYNSQNGNIIAFTDPLGKKCLYKNELGEICSEIKGLYTSNSKIDEIFISTVKKFGYNTDNRTSYTNIKRLLPNNIYSYNIQSPSFETVYEKYYTAWDFPIPELVGKSYEVHMDWLWDKMFESVKNRLV